MVPLRVPGGRIFLEKAVQLCQGVGQARAIQFHFQLGLRDMQQFFRTMLQVIDHKIPVPPQKEVS